MPESLMPILTAVGTSMLSSVGGNLVGKLFGGGGGSQNLQKNVSTKPKPLFAPDMIRQATDRYSSEGNAKWNQIYAQMGAGGGLGGPELAPQISTQAQSMSKALGDLTDQSGYGQTTDIAALMKQLEPSLGVKYSVYN